MRVNEGDGKGILWPRFTREGGGGRGLEGPEDVAAKGTKNEISGERGKEPAAVAVIPREITIFALDFVKDAPFRQT